MDESKAEFDSIREEVGNYVQLRTDLLKALVTEKSSKILALLVSGLLIAGFLFFCLLFISIAGGFYFSTLTGSNILGFGIIALFYLLMALIFIKYRKALIERWLINTVIRIVYDTDEE